MGCMAQLWQGKILERAPQVDLVFGSAALARVGELVERARATGAPVVEAREAPLVKLTAKPDRPGQLKAFVTVMEGCEKFCTFCVVPATRGRERSHPPEAVVAEVRELAAAGVREVTLLGQTVNAYGRDLAPATDLAALLERVDAIDGIERIRFTTSNPYNLTTRLIRAIRDVPKVVEYLHLPLQSGSDRVLDRMNRGYTAARYLELVAELTETVPGIALSTDLIVGFPGETELDFERTVDVVERVRYDNVFAFRYSRRPGTRRRYEDQVPDASRRAQRALLEVAARVAPAEPAPRRPSAGPRGRGSRKDPGEDGTDAVQPRGEFDAQVAGFGTVCRCDHRVLPHSLRGALIAGGCL
jgi:tRNA-2-methylthio-N6-dimethylallyladenosine synthase